ncbi:hypothetical protein EU528_10045 [Candidatus Thorarchaeota archaeon]|nr:MAG: hypothetical protein EU528_10045 [Candidatus Thorarchaeota archaeon]
MIMERGGIPLFFMKLDPKAQDLDPMLVSGFFTAIQSFSKEVIERDSSMFQVDYGARLFTVFSGTSTDFVVVSLGEWDSEVTSVLQSLHDEFESVWIKNLSRKKKDRLKVDTDFPDFREGIVQNLSFRKLSGSWVPYTFGPEDVRFTSSSGIITPLIDGKRTINEIANESDAGTDEVLAEITRLWALGKIKFSSILSKEDIVASTSKIDRLLQLSSPQRAELERKDPVVIKMLPRLSMLFDGRRTVGAIIESLSEEYEERQIIDAIDALVEFGAIVVLSPEKRRLLLVKEATELAVRVAEKIYSPEDAMQFLNAALDKVDVAEVTGVFRLADQSWSIDYDTRLYEGLDPRRLMDLYAEWIKLLAQFVGALDKDKIIKFADALTNTYQSYLFRRYSGHDLRGFEEFSFWLEMNCVRK